MHADLASLLQSNVAQGQFGFSQAVDYLANRNQMTKKSIATSVKTMTSIVVFFNMSRNRWGFR